LLPKWLVVGALGASALEGVRTLMLLKSGSGSATLGDLLFAAVILWLPASLYLLFGGSRQRCSRFDMIMPIEASRLWLTHLLAVTLCGASVLLASAGVVALRDRLVASLPGNPPVPASRLPELGIPLVVALILSVAILQSPRPSLHKTPLGGRYGLLAILIVVGILGLIVGLGLLPPYVALLPLAVALALGLHTFRLLPSGFTLIPREPAERANGSAQRRAAPGSSAETAWPLEAAKPGRGAVARTLFVHRTIFRIFSWGLVPGQLWKAPMNFIAIPLLFLWGLLFSGHLVVGEDIWFLFLVISVYMLFAFLAAPMAQLHLLDPLPISRGVLFALLVLPGLLAMAAGFGVGRGRMLALERAAPAVEFTTRDTRLCPPYPTETAMVRVPSELCAIAWDGRPPEIGSPWGESHVPWSIPVRPGGRAVLYSPYSTPKGSSSEFVALQLSRAVESVYGAAVTPQQISERYVEVDERGVVSVQNGVALLEDLSTPRRSRTLPMFPVIFLIVGLLWLLVAAVYMSSFRVSRTDAARKWAYFGMLGVLLVLHLAFNAVAMVNAVKPWIAVALAKILVLRSGEHLPGGAVAVWIICVLLFLIGYRLALSRFRRIEVPMPRAAQDA
jgi:hypothetical protein